MTKPFSARFSKEVKQLVLQEPAYLHASDRTKLAYYAFLPDRPEASMVFYHGSGTWSNQPYQYLARSLAQEHGIAVYLFDIRGHGNSEGPRGDAPSVKQVWQDVTTAIDFVAARHQEIPLILGGHSAGAGLVLNYTDWHQHQQVQGYLMLAPYLGYRADTAYGHKDPSKMFIKNVKFFPLIVGSLTGGYLCTHWPVLYFNHPEDAKARNAHLLNYHTTAMMLAVSPSDAKKQFSKLDKPVVLLAGEEDEQFNPAKTVAFLNHASRVKEQSEAKILPKAAHLTILQLAPDTIAASLKKLCEKKDVYQD